MYIFKIYSKLIRRDSRWINLTITCVPAISA